MSDIPLPVTRSLGRLGSALSLARRRRNLTQKDLAERIGSSINTVRRLESGHPGSALHHLVRALQVFGALGEFDQLLDTANDSIGLILMDEKLPQRVRKSKNISETGAF